MQATINGPILGIDTITTIRGSQSAVVRVMKIHIDAEDIDWAQAPEPNPDVAMIAFSEIFYLPLELGTRVTLSGPAEVRQALPPDAQAQLQAQVKKVNQGIKTTLQQWIKRNKFAPRATVLNLLLGRLLSDEITVIQFYAEAKKLIYGTAPPKKTPALDKLQHLLHPLLAARYKIAGSAPSVLWFTQAEDIEMRSSLNDPIDDGPLQVIRLDGASLEAKWRQWEKWMKTAK